MINKKVSQEVLHYSKELPVITIVSPNKDVYSETFIHAHIERLPAKVKTLYGGYFPRYQDNGYPLSPPVTLPRRLTRAIIRRMLKVPWDYFEKGTLKRFFLKNNVEAVLAEYGPTGVAVMDTCKETGIPLIVHFHGYDAYNRSVLEEEGQRYPELFENAAAIIAVSRDMERQLLDLGAPRKKLHYNFYGIDSALFQGADAARAPLIFVAVGRFVDKKAPHLTLLAFKKVVESVPDARLIMIGDGPLWEACKQLTQALGIADAVVFPGPRPHMEVAATMQQARVFVQHSIRTNNGDSEGTPVSILEAGATGLPVVATRHAGIPDVVIDGETGFLVEEGDVEGMAECMVRLAKDALLAARLGKAARERICSEFSMEKSIKNLWYIIESTIREHQNQKS